MTAANEEADDELDLAATEQPKDVPFVAEKPFTPSYGTSASARA